MNREILFRGKRIDNGEWVRGLPFSFHANNNVEGIETYDGERHKVDPDTVGQYTGLTDNIGKKIFEGDVLEFYVYGSHYKGVVSFVDGNFRVMCNRPTASPFLDVAVQLYGAYVTNIHDNPELIEGD